MSALLHFLQPYLSSVLKGACSLFLIVGLSCTGGDTTTQSDMQVYTDPQSGISVTLPQAFVAKGSIESGKTDFYADSEAASKEIGSSYFYMYVVTIPSGTTVQEWIASSGVPESDIQEISLGDKLYLKWSTPIDEGGGTIVYSLPFGVNQVLNAVARSQDVADRLQLEQILLTLQLPTGGGK